MFSYLSTAPGSSDRSWVRLTIGDNSSANVELQDEEIDVLISDQGSKERAAIAAARALGARYARKVDKQVGRLRISTSQAAQAYFNLADKLEGQLAQMAGGAGGMYAGGISIADKEAEEADADRVAPAFARGQFDHVRVGSIDRELP